MKIHKEFVLRQIADDYFLVPIGEAVLQHSGLFAMNEVAARIWELLPEAEDESSIVNVLEAEYDASREQLESDVAEFLAKLRKMEII